MLTWKLTPDQEKGVHSKSDQPGVAKALLAPIGDHDSQQDELKVDAATPRGKTAQLIQALVTLDGWQGIVVGAVNALLQSDASKEGGWRLATLGPQGDTDGLFKSGVLWKAKWPWCRLKDAPRSW